MEDITSSQDQSLLEGDEDQVPNPFEQVETTPPIKYVSDEAFDEGEISMDPVKAVQMFYAMALNNKKMTDVSAEAEMIHRIVSEANEVDSEGNISEGSPQRLKGKVKDEIEFLIANNRTKEDEMQSESVDFLTENIENWWRVKNEKKSLENDRDQLKRDFENGEINSDQYENLEDSDFDGKQMTKAEYDELLQNLNNQYKDLGGRSLVWSSLIDNTLLTWGQLKGMALNVGASFRNLSYGIVANFIHAAGGQDFTDGDVLKAMNAILRQTSTRGLAGNKLEAIVDKMGILFETAEVRQGKDRSVSGGRDVYWFQNATEYVAQGLTMISMMMNKKVQDLEGSERPLWDAFDENGNWKTEEFGQREDWQPSTEEGKGEKFTKFGNKVIQLNNRLHGDYSKDSDQKLKKYVLGRLVSMFRTWIPEVFAYRFGGPRSDYHLGREVIGSYRGTWEATKESPMGAALEMLQGITPFMKGDSDQLTEQQKSAISRTAREMQIWLALSALVLAIEPPEDEEASAERKVMINNLMMLQQDVAIYMSPTRIIDLGKNPFPATRTIIDVDRALKGTYEYLGSDDYQGDHPIWKWSQTMPVIKQANTVRWQSERILPE